MKLELLYFKLDSYRNFNEVTIEIEKNRTSTQYIIMIKYWSQKVYNKYVTLHFLLRINTKGIEALWEMGMHSTFRF